MPKGYAITPTDANADGFAFTLKTFVHNGGSTTVENVSWFPPDMKLPSSQPNLQLLKKILARDSLEASMFMKRLDILRRKQGFLASCEQWKIWS